MVNLSVRKAFTKGKQVDILANINSVHGIITIVTLIKNSYPHRTVNEYEEPLNLD